MECVGYVCSVIDRLKQKQKIMETAAKTTITVEATVKAPIEKVWKLWSEPKHIRQWCQASPDWHAPYAENDLRTGGKFKTTMAAKDGSVSFDFEGIYSNVQVNKRIEYSTGYGRKVSIQFSSKGNETHVSETFETESENPLEMQRGGWQAILDSFRNYVEKL
jgi:uncharacterized protein YndB with AHSA1/START domain